MATIWVTYAWVDNEHDDVMFVVQELQRAGLQVKLDRWNIGAGRHLWEQIATFIDSPSESDAWVLYATQASLGSKACKEEIAIALQRALSKRRADFRSSGYSLVQWTRASSLHQSAPA